MKKFTLICLAFLCIVSCRKENSISLPNNAQLTPYLKTVNSYLQDSLLKNDYADIDLFNAVLSRFDNGKTNFLRVPFKSKPAETNFIMLQTDSLGNYINGSIINVIQEKQNERSAGFTGEIEKSFLDGKNFKDTKIVNGNAVNNIKLVMEGPPTTTTDYSGYTSFDLMNITDQFYYYSSGLGGYVPVGSGGGGGTSADNYYSYYTPISGSGKDVSLLEFDSYVNEPAEDINKIFNCFNSIPDAGATYSLTLCSDIPNNYDLNTSFVNSPHVGYPGHTFLILTKTNGNTSVTKAFGFYPTMSWSSLLNLVNLPPVPSKIVNNSEHEINASITMNITQSDFNVIKIKSWYFFGFSV
ncbi:MAG: hypothetical protein ACR2FN_04185 [Chitinophagaceae bacterium]